MRYRVATSQLIVTKLSGEVVQRAVRLHYDEKLDVLGVTFIGDSPVKGMMFEVLQGEFRRVRDRGEPVEELPKVE